MPTFAASVTAAADGGIESGAASNAHAASAAREVLRRWSMGTRGVICGGGEGDCGVGLGAMDVERGGR